MSYEDSSNKNHFSNEGERPKLNSDVKITEEMAELYDVAKTNIVNKRIAGSFGAAAILIMAFVRTEGMLFLIQLGITAVLGLIALVLYIRYKKLSNGVDIESQYIENCIVPIANQIVPDVTVRQTLQYFPLYGKVFTMQESIENEIANKYGEDMSCKANNLLNFAKKGTSKFIHSYDDFGKYLEEKCVIPKFNSYFETNFVIDSLTNNKEGFLFTNATATTQVQTKNGTRVDTNFEGPIVAMRMKHAVRSGVSIYASKKGVFGKEGANGYRKVDTIDTENEEFNKSFEVSAEEESQAFFVLSPLVMENLLKMKEMYGNFGLYIEDDFLVFGFNLRKQLLQMPENYSAAKKMDINKTVEDIVGMLNMIYDFKDAVDLNFDTTM